MEMGFESMEKSKEEVLRKREEMLGKISEMLNRLEKIIDEIKKADITRKEELVKELERVARNLEISTKRLLKPLEVEELREVKELIKTLGEVGKDVVGTIVVKLGEFFDGKRLGENISALYTSLKNTGMPDDMIKEIVMDYVKRTLTVVPEVYELISKFLVMTQRPGREEGLRQQESQ
jgi:hypothetical protein